MQEQYILARAQQEVAARRMAEVEQRWGGWKRRVLPLVVLVLLGMFAAAPGTLSQKLLWAMGGVCNLRPSHSYFAGNMQLPLEARMIGIYGGFMVTLLLLIGLRRWGKRRLGNSMTLALVAVMFGSMVFDGVNSTLMEMKQPHFYTTTNPIRLATGLLSGAALAPFLLWLAGVVLLPKASLKDGVVVRGTWELAILFAVNAVLGALILSGNAVLYYPLALLGVSGMVVVLTGVLLLPIVTLSDVGGRISHLRHLVAPASLALVLAFVVLAALAVLRWTTIGALA